MTTEVLPRHKELADKIVMLGYSEGRGLGEDSSGAAAQLIAESEARAVESALKEIRNEQHDRAIERDLLD